MVEEYQGGVQYLHHKQVRITAFKERSDLGRHVEGLRGLLDIFQVCIWE